MVIIKKVSKLKAISLLLILISFFIFTNFASAQKLDYLKFRDADYISSCGPNTKCKMCFDLIKAREFTSQELDWKTHIADVETKTKDYSSFVENLQLKRKYLKELNETIGYNYVTNEKNYTCNYNINSTLTTATCYENFFNVANNTNSSRTHFQHEYTRIGGNAIFWNESQAVSAILRKINRSVEEAINILDLANSIISAPLGSNYTICLEGNVALGSKVDVYPEIFGYNYTEYAIWEGNKVSLLFSNWSEWNNTRFNNTVWMPYSNVLNDNLTLEYVYIPTWNFTHANGTDVWADPASGTVDVSSNFSVLNYSNDYGTRRTSTANIDARFFRNGALDPNLNYSVMFDFYPVTTSTSHGTGFRTTAGESCTVGDIHFASANIEILDATCGTWRTLIPYSTGSWIHVEEHGINFSAGAMRELVINGTITNRSLTGKTTTNNVEWTSEIYVNTESYLDTLRVCIENQDGNCNYTTQGILQSYPIFFSTSFNQVNCTYLAVTPSGTSVTVNVSANNGTSWTTCNNNAVTSLGATVSNIIANIELKGNSTARPMMNYALNLTVSTSGGVQGGGSSGNISNETAGDDAIERAINSSFSSPAKFKSRQLYVRYYNSTQILGKFDWFIIQSSPPRRWAINYVTANDSTSGLTNMLNITPIFRVLELQNLTEANITDSVGDMLNLTKS